MHRSLACTTGDYVRRWLQRTNDHNRPNAHARTGTRMHTCTHACTHKHCHACTHACTQYERTHARARAHAVHTGTHAHHTRARMQGFMTHALKHARTDGLGRLDWSPACAHGPHLWPCPATNPGPARQRQQRTLDGTDSRLPATAVVCGVVFRRCEVFSVVLCLCPVVFCCSLFVSRCFLLLWLLGGVGATCLQHQ
jgi:hypothetical protein